MALNSCENFPAHLSKTLFLKGTAPFFYWKKGRCPLYHPRFKKGLELFNKGEFFECHEVIEDLWLETPSDDPYRDLYKGVIQAAAAVYQFERGILSGALGLFETSTLYLEKYAPKALGLDVRQLIDDMKKCFRPLDGWDRQSDIQLDDSSVPKLKFLL